MVESQKLCTKPCVQTPVGLGGLGWYDLHVSMPTMQVLRKLSPEDLEVEFKESYTRSGVKQSTTTKLVKSKFIYKYK